MSAQYKRKWPEGPPAILAMVRSWQSTLPTSRGGHEYLPHNPKPLVSDCGGTGGWTYCYPVRSCPSPCERVGGTPHSPKKWQMLTKTQHGYKSIVNDSCQPTGIFFFKYTPADSRDESKRNSIKNKKATFWANIIHSSQHGYIYQHLLNRASISSYCFLNLFFQRISEPKIKDEDFCRSKIVYIPINKKIKNKIGSLINKSYCQPYFLEQALFSCTSLNLYIQVFVHIDKNNYEQAKIFQKG